ncbi:LPS export ABC transporter periplasmic protein LptC [Chamaesiphon sp. VAR_48_metabat_403]|uniref:LPS export ABC transporter periplasmic protein LptC n=1 Tax=Chamaesiphon sp. VAR_48_metabat_403 TaxID=2964700 RepID=UPI00286E257B|nr:LPS export ABC transporter periplasmic protein LptC [Chamaesiphon sp. VAR_48_metabat_403]
MKVYHGLEIVLTIAILGMGGCSRQPAKLQPTPTPTAVEAKLSLDNLSFEQVDKQGKPLWKVRAQRGVYAPDRKTAKVTNITGDLYQDGQIILHLTAKSGELEQAGEKIVLRGDVVATETRNNLVIIGQEVTWQPKADLLTIRNRVRATQPKLQVDANEGKYISRKQQLDLAGKITAFSTDPRLAMQTEHLTWLVKDQKVIGDRLTQIQRYTGNRITDRVVANNFSSALDRKIINLQGNVRLDATNPIIQVNGESFSWNLGRELITADRPLKIVHLQESLVFDANAGELDLKASTATLTGNATGIATRNQTKLRSDRLIWQIASQQLVGTGNVVYQQVDPVIKFTGTRGIGKLQDRSIVVSSDGKQQVRTEFIPK